MEEHLTFESMEMNTDYQCIMYRPLYGSCGYYYVIEVKTIVNNVNYIMVITDGCIYDKLEKFRLGTTPGVKFTFKKASVDSINPQTGNGVFSTFTGNGGNLPPIQ